MARIRTIKPEFFVSERIGDLTPMARLFFIGLWTVADREGRIEWRPRRIQAQIFPYDGDIRVHTLAEELVAAKLLVFYEGPDVLCAYIPGFARHQRPHPKEAASVLPAPPEDGSADGVTPWRPTPDYVYFIRNPLDGSIKIGRTKRPEWRLKELQTSSGVDLELVGVTTQANESELHQQLKDFRMSGEWFRDCPEVKAVLGRFLMHEAAMSDASVMHESSMASLPVATRVVSHGEGKEISGRRSQEGNGEVLPPFPPPGGGARVVEISPDRRRFERWYASYPEKTGIGGAWRAWKRIRPAPDDALTDEMIAAVERQKASDRWQRGFICLPSTWLNQQRWLDKPDSKQALIDEELERFRPKGA